MIGNNFMLKLICVFAIFSWGRYFVHGALGRVDLLQFFIDPQNKVPVTSLVSAFSDAFWTLALTDQDVHDLYKLPLSTENFVKDIYDELRQLTYEENILFEFNYAEQVSQLIDAYRFELSTPKVFANSITNTIGRYLGCTGILTTDNAANLGRAYFEAVKNQLKELDRLSASTTESVKSESRKKIRVLSLAKGQFLKNLSVKSSNMHMLFARIFDKTLQSVKNKNIDSDAYNWCS